MEDSCIDVCNQWRATSEYSVLYVRPANLAITGHLKNLRKRDAFEFSGKSVSQLVDKINEVMGPIHPITNAINDIGRDFLINKPEFVKKGLVQLCYREVSQTVLSNIVKNLYS